MIKKQPMNSGLPHRPGRGRALGGRAGTGPRVGRPGWVGTRSRAWCSRPERVGAKRRWQPVCCLGSPEARRCGSRGCSAAGSAPPWHGGGQGFESPQLHQEIAVQGQRLTRLRRIWRWQAIPYLPCRPAEACRGRGGLSMSRWNRPSSLAEYPPGGFPGGAEQVPPWLISGSGHAGPRPAPVAGHRAQPDVPAVGSVAPNASPRPVRSTESRACPGTWSRNGRIASRAARISRPT